MGYAGDSGRAVKEGQMYIRTQDEAREAVAEILELPERRDQIIQATVRIMLCLDVEPRVFMADCQALLLSGGLDALSDRRRTFVEHAEELPVGVVDPVEDRLFEEVASAIDALRLSNVVRQVFPGIRCDRWQVARALSLYESGMKEQVVAALRARGDAATLARAHEAVEGMITALRPPWIDRIGALRAACLEGLRREGTVDPDRLYPEAEALFEMAAVVDSHVAELLAAIDADPAGAAVLARRLHEVAEAVRALPVVPPPEAPLGDVRDVA